MTDFYFIRHGQTTANVRGLKQGTMNTAITELNETGLAQAANLRDRSMPKKVLQARFP